MVLTRAGGQGKGRARGPWTVCRGLDLGALWGSMREECSCLHPRCDSENRWESEFTVSREVWVTSLITIYIPTGVPALPTHMAAHPPPGAPASCCHAESTESENERAQACPPNNSFTVSGPCSVFPPYYLQACFPK